MSSALPTFADTISVLVPYAGMVSNKYDDSGYGIHMEDNGFMAGGYFQMVNPESYQWNTFLYFAPDVNDSRIAGFHFNLDGYLFNRNIGHFTVGTGLEYLRLDMDAGDSLSGLDDFEMVNNIWVNYYRFGYHFLIDFGNVEMAVFPWSGIQLDMTRGEVAVDPTGPPPRSVSSIGETEPYGIVGLNLRLNLFHFIDMEAKYRGCMNRDRYLNSCSAMVNFYFTKSVGASYRFKYTETSSGHELYHLLGVVFVFR